MGSGVAFDYGLFSVSLTLKDDFLHFCCHGNLNHFSHGDSLKKKSIDRPYLGE